MNMFRHRMRRNVFVVSISALALAPFVIFAWVGPTAAPPGNNVAAPINVGNVDQVKNGGLGLNSLAVFGNSLFGGSTGSNAYLNFGPTSGTNGYGIRDNGGTMEFKNLGETGGDNGWKSLQEIVFTLCGGGACGGGGGASSIVSTSARIDQDEVCNGLQSIQVSCPAGYTVSGCEAWTAAYAYPAGAELSGNGCLGGCRGPTATEVHRLAVEAICTKLQ